MKKLILLMSFILLSYLGFSQATPTEVLRIANKTTAMGKNLSTGKLVYDMQDSILWVTNKGVASTLTLTTGATSFTMIGGAGELDSPWKRVGEKVLLTHISDSVGIGTETPTETLTVAGSGVFSDTLHVNASLKLDEFLYDEDAEKGAVGDVLSSTATGTDWISKSVANYTLFTEKFEETSGTALTHTLTNGTAQLAGATVALNGAMLDPAFYTLTATTIKIITIPVLQYDIVTITYNY